MDRLSRNRTLASYFKNSHSRMDLQSKSTYKRQPISFPTSNAYETVILSNCLKVNHNFLKYYIRLLTWFLSSLAGIMLITVFHYNYILTIFFKHISCGKVLRGQFLIIQHITFAMNLPLFRLEYICNIQPLLL